MPGLAGEVANLIVALKLDDSGFTGKLNSAARSLKGMDSGLRQVGRGAGQVAGGVAAVAERTALLGAAAGGFAIVTAASFEQAEAGIRKTVGGTTDEVDDLIGSIRDMSREVPVSFEELAAIAAEGGALGVATGGLREFTEIVARLGVSTDLTTDQASTALGQLSNVLGLSDRELRDFADSLVALGNDGASTESQILDMTARFGAAGRAAGLSNEQILALASSTASMGIEAEAGGGALSRIFQNLTVDMATASDEGRLLADTLGLSLDDLKDAWDQDAGAVFRDLLEHINKLDQFDAAAFLSDLGITNTRDVNAIRNLATNVEEYGRQLGVAEGQTDELNRESDAFFNTTQGKWQTLKNNVRLAADTIGSEMLPVVNDLADDFIDFLNKPETQRGLTQFAKDLAEGVRDLATELKGTDFSGIIGGVKLAAEVAKGAFDAFRSLPQPIQQLAIAALVANKVSGGAIGQIAKGLGNILLGSLKTITAGNVTVIGGNVTGGPGGVGGGKGGGFAGLGLLGTAGLAAGALAGITVAGTEIHRNLAPTEHQFNELVGGKASRVQVEGDLLRISKDTGVAVSTLERRAINLLESGDMTWSQIVDALEEQKNASQVQAERAASFDKTLIQNATTAEGRRYTQMREALGADRALVNSAAQQTQKMQDSIRIAQEAKGADQTLIQLSRNAEQYQSRTATATEATSRKNFDPKIINDITVPVNVAVNASVVQQQVYRLRQTTGGGGFI